MQLQIVITMLLQAFRTTLAPQPPVECEAILSIRPKNGIKFVAEAIDPTKTPNISSEAA